MRWIENADAKMDTRVELASVLPSELRIAELRRAAVSEGLPPAEAAAMGEVTVRAFLQKRWPTTHVGLMPAARVQLMNFVLLNIFVAIIIDGGRGPQSQPCTALYISLVVLCVSLVVP